MAVSTRAHLVSWAKFAPIDKDSAGKKRNGSTGCNPWLGGNSREVDAGVGHANTFDEC